MSSVIVCKWKLQNIQRVVFSNLTLQSGSNKHVQHWWPLAGNTPHTPKVSICVLTCLSHQLQKKTSNNMSQNEARPPDDF